MFRSGRCGSCQTSSCSRRRATGRSRVGVHNGRARVLLTVLVCPPCNTVHHFDTPYEVYALMCNGTCLVLTILYHDVSSTVYRATHPASPILIAPSILQGSASRHLAFILAIVSKANPSAARVLSVAPPRPTATVRPTLCEIHHDNIPSTILMHVRSSPM